MIVRPRHRHGFSARFSSPRSDRPLASIRHTARPVAVGLCLLWTAACATSPTSSPTPASGLSTALPLATISAVAETLVATIAVTPVPPATTAPLIATTASNTTLPTKLPSTAVPTAAVPLAAVVNHTGQITVAVLDAEVSRQLVARQSLNEPVPADMTAFRHSILDSLIQQMLIEQAAAIQHVTVSDQEVEAEVQKYIQASGGRDKWLAQVAADHMTEADYRAGLYSALLTLKMRDFVTRNIGAAADQVHARHILVADLATAQQVLTQLKSGTDFAGLAARYSLDVTTKNSGGDLGWFTRGQLLQPAIENMAFSMALNQFSTPIQTDLGFDVLEVVERAANRPLDPAVRARLSEQTFEIWLQTLLKAAQITKYV